MSKSTHGMHPATVSNENRATGIRAAPAGSEMNVRTIGSIRAKNTALDP